MKKTLTINLNGTVFNIDEDAYALLDEYIRNLRIYFRKETDSNEIVADIEARAAELFSERLHYGYTVIDMDEVKKVIEKIGQPQDFGDDEEAKSFKGAKASGATTTASKKRLYRDVDNKLLGGVLSGVAAYFGWDVTLFRLVSALVIIGLSSMYGGGIWLYLIMWIIVPAAKTAEQKLEMRGEEVSVGNIGKTVAEPPVQKKSGFFRGMATGCGCILAAPILLPLGIVAFVFAVVLISLIAALFGVGIGMLSLPFTGWWGMPEFVTFAHPVPAFIAACFLLFIPLASLVYVLLAAIFKWKTVPMNVRWVGVIVWIIALLVLITSGIKLNRNHNWNNWHWNISKWEVNDSDDAIRIEGDGQLDDLIYTVPAFTKILLNSDVFGNLRLVQTSTDSSTLLVNGDSNIIDKVNWKVEDGVLRLSLKDGYAIRGRNNLIIKASMPVLNELEIRSLSSVTADSRLKSESFRVKIDGAGKFQADSLEIADVLYVDVNGAGVVDVGGKARRAEYKMDGVGKINAHDLEAQEVKAYLNGVGQIRCDAIETIDAKVDGVGKITYKREPKVRNTQVNGVGKIGKE